MELRKWDVWNMTRDEKRLMEMYDITDFAKSKILNWDEIESYYDIFTNKWYFLYRDRDTHFIIRVNLH